MFFCSDPEVHQKAVQAIFVLAAVGMSIFAAEFLHVARKPATFIIGGGALGMAACTLSPDIAIGIILLAGVAGYAAIPIALASCFQKA